MDALLQRRTMLGGGEAKPKANEVFYWAPEQITLATATGVANHTFSNGKGVLTLTNPITTFQAWFNGKSSLTRIECDWERVTSFASYALYNTYNLVQDINAPNATGTLDYLAEGSGITSFVAPKVTAASYRTTPNPHGNFRNCRNITRIYTPKLKFTSSINSWFANGCAKLTKVIIDYANTTILPSTFIDASPVTGDIIAPKCVEITTDTFRNSKITSFIGRAVNKGGDGVEGSIRSGIFRGCSALKYVEFAAIPRIYNYMFLGCKSLETLVIDNTTPPTFGSNVFDSSPNLSIYVPDSAVDTYKEASGWSNLASRIHPLSELPQ